MSCSTDRIARTKYIPPAFAFPQKSFTTNVPRRHVKILTLIAILLITAARTSSANAQPSDGIFADDNLVAWCIVPFDASRRTPAQRAEMLNRLGLKHVAYDWRAEHVPTFEEEIQQYQKHNLNYFAFWSWHDDMEPLIKKYDIHPQIWVMMINSAAPTQEARIEEAGRSLLPLVEKTRSLGCKLGIYNHGGWAGEPENMIAVVQWLRKHHQASHVGIVYNFHHGHEHMANFKAHMADMKPFLICLNINGMDDADTVAAGNNKIVPVGSGKHEQTLLKIVEDSGYTGRIGILDHRSDMDAEESLKQNLDGLHKLRRQGL